MNAFQEIDRLCDQWERNAKNLPPDARHLLRQTVKRIVLEAAAICDRRSVGRPISTGNEAKKCAMAVRHYLLCNEGESICLRCDGAGCEWCKDGIKSKIQEQLKYGYCPHCGAACKLRERRLNGNDTCENGHVYPSAEAV